MDVKGILGAYMCTVFLSPCSSCFRQSVSLYTGKSRYLCQPAFCYAW